MLWSPRFSNSPISKQIEKLFSGLHYGDLEFFPNPIRKSHSRFKISENHNLSAGDDKLYSDIRFYFCVKFENLLSPIETNIFKYLERSVKIQELGLDKDNARAYLKSVKLIDLAKCRYYHSEIHIRRTTYKIRQRILELCSPDMTTCEAFTMTPDPLQFRNPDYLKKPQSWVARRVGHQAKIVANEFIKALTLSSQLDGDIIKAWRANTCAGKSSEADFQGCLNVDNFKAPLKRRTTPDARPYLVSKQVHDECSALFYYNYRKEIAEHPIRYKCRSIFLSYVLDSRLLTLHELEECVITPAKMRNCPAHVVDLDVPLKTSLNRVLVTRDPYGTSPCVSTEVVKSGFIRLRQHHAAIVERVIQENLIKSYKLFFTSAEGSKKLIYEKQEGRFTVYAENEFNESKRVPSEEEIRLTLDQVITPQYIEEAIARGDVRSETKPAFTKWIGYPLAQAVDIHANGL